MIERSNQCSCGSNLKCLEPDSNGKKWVICLGIGCDKKWELRREEDKDLPLLNDVRDAWK